MIHSAAPVVAGNNCWATGGSSAFDRQKYLQLGGMDRLYAPAYWEDIDLSWRAREKFGWQILFEPKSQVFHNHETTNVSVFGQRQMELMALRNQFLFVWKNIRDSRLLQSIYSGCHIILYLPLTALGGCLLFPFSRLYGEI